MKWSAWQLLPPKIEALLGVDVHLKVASPAAGSPSLSVAIFAAAAWAHLAPALAQADALGLSRSDVFGIVGELVVGCIAEIEVTGDNRHIEVRE